MDSLVEKINTIKKEKNILILAHYYQNKEIQEIADFVGDSYYLSKLAKDSNSNTILFCGVNFMAESAKILSPRKKILTPVLDAGCPMADMATADKLKEWKCKYPDYAVVTYINSSTSVKALSDVIVTSSNAEKIISKLNNDKILFLPDKNLGAYLSKKFPNKKFVLWPGYCPVHQDIDRLSIINLKEKHSNLKVFAHPECDDPILKEADFIGSTGEIIAQCKDIDDNNILIITEEGILHTLKKNSPDKNFLLPSNNLICENMKKISLDDVYSSLVNEDYEVTLSNEEIKNSSLALEKMHELAD